MYESITTIVIVVLYSISSLVESTGRKTPFHGTTTRRSPHGMVFSSRLSPTKKEGYNTPGYQIHTFETKLHEKWQMEEWDERPVWDRRGRGGGKSPASRRAEAGARSELDPPEAH